MELKANAVVQWMDMHRIQILIRPARPNGIFIPVKGLYVLYLEYKSVCPYVRIGSPPLPLASVSPPEPKGGYGGGGGGQFGRALCILCVYTFLYVQCPHP
jgi:hypothetical protein